MDKIKCCITGKEQEAKPRKDGQLKLPRGWREWKGQPYSAEGWKRLFYCRAVTIPVVCPLPEDDKTKLTLDERKRLWAELNADLRDAWVGSTALANWAFNILWSRDVFRTPDSQTGDKMPKMKPVDLYHEACAAFPTMRTGTIGAMLRALDAKYRARRYLIKWSGKERLGLHKYPVPCPIKAETWKLTQTARGMVVSMPLRSRRWRLLLRGGKDWARSLASLKQVVDGSAKATELTFYRRPASRGDHRSEQRGKGQDHGPFETMLKIVAHFPKRLASGREGVLCVSTCPDALLVARSSERDKNGWWYNGDKLRRWIAEYDRRLQRAREDMKHELRVRRHKGPIQPAWTNKQHNRVKTFIQQLAASLAKFAVRQKVAEVVYDDSLRTYLPSFDYSGLRLALDQALDAEHIPFTTLDVRRKAAKVTKAEDQLLKLEALLRAMLAEQAGESVESKDELDDAQPDDIG